MTCSPVNVILGADALLRRATGIGVYTRSLARHLQQAPEIGSLRLFANGLFLNEDFLSRDSVDQGDTADLASHSPDVPSREPFATKIRSVAAHLPGAPALYKTVMPVIERVRLSPFKDDIFHSPNYLVPHFDGRKVVTFHDLSIQRYPEFHPAQRVRLLVKQMERSVAVADHVITDTELVRGEVIRFYGLPPEKVTAIPLAASPWFAPRNEQQCSAVLDRLRLPYKGFFLFASTIEPRKNIRRICAAYKDLRRSTQVEYPLIFVGAAGWSSAAEHSDIQELESLGWGRYLEYVDTATLSKLYSAAAALVFPSIYEGFGLPALEAQQSGTPVITTAASAMSEFSAPHDILVDPYEVSDIRDAMKSLAERQHSATGAREQQAQTGPDLSWAKTAARTAELYASL